MRKRKKAIIITLTVLAVIYFLLIGAGYFYLRLFVFPATEQYRVTGAYPYSNAAIPGDYTEYSMQGIKLAAPGCLEAETDAAGSSIYLSKDTATCDLLIIAAVEEQSASENLEWVKEQPHLLNKWITGRGWLTRLGMKLIGYKIPENNNELLYLLEKSDSTDYNPFSLPEAYAFTKLSILKAVFIPAILDTSHDEDHPLETPLEVEECSYYVEKDSFSAIIRQGCSEGGRYRLTIRYYPDSAADPVRFLLIQSDDPELAQTVAASVQPA